METPTTLPRPVYCVFCGDYVGHKSSEHLKWAEARIKVLEEELINSKNKKLTDLDLRMCQSAVGFVSDHRDLTEENKKEWDMLWDKLGIIRKESVNGGQQSS